MDRVVWVGASPRSDAEEIRTVVSSALAVGFGEVVLSKPDESLQRLGRFSPILLQRSTFVLGDAEVRRGATIRSAKDEPLVRAMRGATKHVVVRLEPWKVIPLENLIAYFQGSGTRLLVEVHDAAEAKLVFETMEVGADGIFLTPSSLDEVRAPGNARAGGGGEGPRAVRGCRSGEARAPTVAIGRTQNRCPPLFHDCPECGNGSIRDGRRRIPGSERPPGGVGGPPASGGRRPPLRHADSRDDFGAMT